ncbi:unnamed protein product [Ectocarpus fasciculatus]
MVRFSRPSCETPAAVRWVMLLVDHCHKTQFLMDRAVVSNFFVVSWKALNMLLLACSIGLTCARIGTWTESEPNAERDGLLALPSGARNLLLLSLRESNPLYFYIEF